MKTGTTNPWMRLTPYGVTFVMNPTIDLGARVRFDIHADKSIKVALGVRETGTSAAIGADGGATGAIEWLGASKTGTSPNPSRVVNANVWTTLEFNLPAEVCTNFSAGNNVLAAGKGVLEHLAIVPNGGMGAYTVYIDNLEVVSTPTLPGTVTMNAGSTLTFTAAGTDPDPGSGLAYGLEAGAPPEASINSSTGAFTMTPAGVKTDVISVYVNDNPTNGAPIKSTSLTFTVVANADPLAVQTVADNSVAPGETVELVWDSVPGMAYRVQSNSGDGTWTDVAEIMATSDETQTVVSNVGKTVQFHRIVSGGDSNQ